MADETLQAIVGARLTLKQHAFLAAYGESASITTAAEAADVARQSHYDWMKDNEDYQTAFREARSRAIDLLEQEAIRRAYHGVDEPVFHQGQLCYRAEDLDENGKPQPGVTPLAIRRYSDRLMEILLRGNKPDIYRDRSSVEVTGKDGTPLMNVAMMDRILRETDDDPSR